MTLTRRMGAGAKEATSALIECLKDDDEEVRKQGVLSLGKIGQGATAQLIRALGHSDVDVRLVVVKALDRIRPTSKGVVAALLRTLKDKNAEIRREAADVLGGLRDPAAVPALIRLVRTDEGEVRLYAVVALANIGPDARAAVPALTDAMKEGGELGRSAGSALGKMGQFAVPALVGVLKDAKSEKTHGQAARSLAEIGPAAKAAVPALIEALNEEGGDVRRAVIWAFYCIGPDARAAFPALARAVKDDSPSERIAIAAAMCRIAPDNQVAVPILIQGLKDNAWEVRNEAAQALEVIGPKANKAVPDLIEALKDSESIVRTWAAHALGSIGSTAKAAIPALKKAEKDRDQAVREAAIEAIHKIQNEVNR